MRVGVQGLDRASVPEASLHRLDALAVPDEQRRVVVPERVQPGGPPAALLLSPRGATCARTPAD